MCEEFTTLLNSGTRVLVEPKVSMNMVGCKWVFKIEKKSDGTLERYKAQLVAKGLHQ